MLSLVSQSMTFVLFKLDIGMFFFLNDVTQCKSELPASFAPPALQADATVTRSTSSRSLSH